MDDPTAHLTRAINDATELLGVLIGRLERPLPRDHDLEAVADALGMSTRWVRVRVAEGAAHQRYGHVIKFTTEQVEALRAAHTRAAPEPIKRSITTGRRRNVL